LRQIVLSRLYRRTAGGEPDDRKKDLDGGDFRAKKGGAGAEWCCRICKRPLHVIVYDPNARPEFKT
jgi:hypothetical protein